MKFPEWPEISGINKICLGLERMKALLDKLGNPEKKIPLVFHITGTNGKGSVSAFLKYILEEQGYKVHRYTSPHLVDFNERIEIAGSEITDEYYNELASECRDVIEKNKLDASYFEIVTAIAFMAFSRNDANAVILEVGMGGRLDATNVIENPLVSIFTTISYDHMSALGDTLSKIAFEKSKIAKKGCPVIISRQRKEASDTLNEEIKKLSCPIYEYGINWKYDKINDNSCIYEGIYKMFKTPLPSLLGQHQIINAGTAISAILCQNKLFVSEKAICEGISKTQWQGRLQKIENTKLNTISSSLAEIYIDGAHNEDGARVLKEWIDSENKKEMKQNVLILSILGRKDYKNYINNIKSVCDKVILLKHNKSDLNSYREVEELQKYFESIGIKSIKIVSSIYDAFKATKDRSKIKKRVVCCGSLYFMGEILALIREEKNKEK